MSIRFAPKQGPIIVPVRMWGLGGSGILRFVLDTGATESMANAAPLMTLGYDPALSPDRVQVTTVSGVEFAPRVVIERIVALDNDRTDFPMLCHTLPPSAGVDGILGLDFMRGQSLHVDFRAGEITLS